jgi:hypothetical protein
MPTTTPRLRLPSPTPDDAVDVPRDFTALTAALDLNTAQDYSGVAANRPAPATVPGGSYYFATDTGVLSRSDGAAWGIVTPAADSVGAAQIQDGTVGTAELAASAVTTAKIADANVTTAKVVDQAITLAKIAAAAQELRLLGVAALGAYNVGPNGNTVLGSVVCTHTGGRAGMWLLIEFGNPSGGGAASQFRVLMDGGTTGTVANANGSIGSAAMVGTFGAVAAGAHTWSGSVEMGNVPYSTTNGGQGVLVVFEF